MKAAIGQRWVYRNPNDGRSFVAEVIAISGISYKVVQLINEKTYYLGQECYYGGGEFNDYYWTYLEGQDAPK